MSSDNSVAAVAYLLLALILSWLIIYTAVGAGVGHAMDRIKPRLLAEAQVTPEGVQFTMVNVGTGPAFDLFVRWSEDPTGEPLARTPMLGVNGRLEWTVPVRAEPDESQAVRRLRLDWSDGLEQEARWESGTRAVLVPSRLRPPST
jgi:hypothetical protein